MPCYNQEKYIRQTLENVISQDLKDWECILINDGSKDKTLSILRTYESKDSRFVVIDKENGGPSSARNAGLKIAKGKYILPLDSDDLIDKTYTTKAIDYLETHPNVKLVYCKAKYFGKIEKEWNLKEYNFDTMLFENCIFCSAIFRKCDVDLTDGYNIECKGGYEDWDFWLSFLNKDDIVYQIPEILFYYRQHNISRNTQANKNGFALKHQLILNHINLYKGHEKELVILYKKEYDLLKTSLTYKLGHILLFPIRVLFKLFRINRF